MKDDTSVMSENTSVMPETESNIRPFHELFDVEISIDNTLFKLLVNTVPELDNFFHLKY